MSGSAFRKGVQSILQQTPDNADACRQIAQLMRDQGVSVKMGWTRSLMEPGLLGIRERSLGDSRIEALEMCRFLVADLGVDLISAGVVSADEKVLARLPEARKPKRLKMS